MEVRNHVVAVSFDASGARSSEELPASALWRGSTTTVPVQQSPEACARLSKLMPRAASCTQLQSMSESESPPGPDVRRGLLEGGELWTT
jgi:hypothetical protein